MRVLPNPRGPILLALFAASVIGCGGDDEAQPTNEASSRPGEKSMEQKVEPLTPDDIAYLEAKRKWVRDHYTKDAEERYATVKGKLAVLHTILESGWIEPDETVKLQHLGITFGDALAQEAGLEWVMVEDEHGRDPALQLKGTSILVFPMTTISKRIERGETVDVYDLFADALGTIERVRREAD